MSEFDNAVWDIELTDKEVKKLIGEKVQEFDNAIQNELSPEINALLERITTLQVELNEIEAALK